MQGHRRLNSDFTFRRSSERWVSWVDFSGPAQCCVRMPMQGARGEMWPVSCGFERAGTPMSSPKHSCVCTHRACVRSALLNECPVETPDWSGEGAGPPVPRLSRITPHDRVVPRAGVAGPAGTKAHMVPMMSASGSFTEMRGGDGGVLPCGQPPPAISSPRPSLTLTLAFGWGGSSFPERAGPRAVRCAGRGCRDSGQW